ncbi:MAG: helix-turn-helix transcriptional regulator [Euzebya sp.]
MAKTPTPRDVVRARRVLGSSLANWRKLHALTTGQVADRAGVTRKTVENLEKGRPSSLETYLRVARSLGLLDQVVKAVDPMETDLGRARAEEHLPVRVRRRG